MSSWVKRLLAIVIGGGLVFYVGSRVYTLKQEQAGSGAQKKKKGGARVVSVDLSAAEIGQVREELVLTGALKPKESVDVMARSAGRITDLHFQVGDTVDRGALLAELEDDELQQRLRRAEASIAVNAASVQQRRAELSNVKANLGRSEQLFKEGLLSPQEYDQQKTSLAMVEAQVELASAQQQQTEAELRELKIQLEQAKIYTPMAGVVAIRYIDEGALVTPSNPIVRIVNLATMVTQGNVPERNVGKLRVGNQAEVRVDAIPDEVFYGRVARIAPVLDAATRSALIEIDILNPQRVLKAEMFARINLDLGTMREATLIPRDGLVYRGQQPGVYVVDDENRPVFQAVETGMMHQNQVEVLANLDPGTRIVGRGATMLRDGDMIAVAGAGGKKGGKKGGGADGAPAEGASEATEAPAEGAPGKAGKKGGGGQKKAPSRAAAPLTGGATAARL